MTYSAVEVRHRPYTSAVEDQDGDIVAYTRHFEDAIRIAAAMNAAEAAKYGEGDRAVEFLEEADAEIARRCVVEEEAAS